jgi:hypothetical protein
VFLIALTGGSAISPFTPMLLVIPTLSIFLRLPATAFISHGVIVGLFFLTLLHPQFIRGVEGVRRSFAFMSIFCLVITLLTGYITRPVSIDQLNQPPKITPLGHN